MDEKKLIEAAKLLQSYCKKHPNCDGCMFCSCGICELDCCPSVWQLPKARRWTDADIALAKALKAFGTYSVQRVSIDGGILCSGGNGCGGVPKGAFANLQQGETVLLDEIIAEGEDG